MTTRETSGRIADPIMEEFHAAVAVFDAQGWHAVSDALRSLLAAMAYQDRPLVRSHMGTALVAMIEAAGSCLDDLINKSASIRSACHRVAEVGGSPGEDLDKLGRSISDKLPGLVEILSRIRDGIVRAVNAAGVEFPPGKALEAEIRELESLQAALLSGWPWSHLPLPASDPAMLARARAESERGEGVPIEELIRSIEAGN